MLDYHSSDLRMIVGVAALGHLQDVMTRPPLRELRAHRLEPLDQLHKMRIASMTPKIGAESGERARPRERQSTIKERSVGLVKTSLRTFRSLAGTCSKAAGNFVCVMGG